jgi:TonB family protein
MKGLAMLRGFLSVLAISLLLPASSQASGRTLAQARKDCEKKNGDACIELLAQYVFGDGVSHEPEKARAFLEGVCLQFEHKDSCELPATPLACRRLGQMYERGERPVTPNTARAVAFYDRASAKGDALSTMALVRLHATGRPGEVADEKAMQELVDQACTKKTFLTRSCGATEEQATSYQQVVEEACRQRSPEAAAATGPHPLGNCVRVGGDLQAPHKIKDVRPHYPAAASEHGVQGVVMLDARIREDGTVAEMVPLVDNDPRLVAAAIDAVQHWVYTPTLVNGKPVAVTMTVTVTFKLAR